MIREAALHLCMFKISLADVCNSEFVQCLESLLKTYAR